MNSTRMTYTCRKCQIVQMMSPDVAERGCLICDGELEETPGATLNFVLTGKAKDVFPWINIMAKRDQLHAQFLKEQQEAGK